MSSLIWHFVESERGRELKRDQAERERKTALIVDRFIQVIWYQQVAPLFWLAK